MSSDAEPAPALSADSATAQLFRYAQDMGELMRQYDRLRQHHQMILQSLGREVHTNDLLPGVLADANPLYWVTDMQGDIVRTSSQAGEELEQRFGRQSGHNLVNLLLASQRSTMQRLLLRFSGQSERAGALQCRLQLAGETHQAQGPAYDALAMLTQRNGHAEICWLLRPATEPAASPLRVLSGFIQDTDSEHGVMLASPFGTIFAVNSGFCAITGYSAAELVGNNPRMLSSGRQDSNFYQEFWLELLDKGSWSGTIFNRRKGGQIFLEWQAIKMVEDEAGQVVGYVSSMVDLTFTDPTAKNLETMAYTDPLTGLPNRRMLVGRLSQAIGQSDTAQPALALLFMDLNRFKPINDELGHEVGDLVLQEVARRLRDALLPSDLLARVGGDEFVVLLSGTRRVAQAEDIAGHMQTCLAPSMRIRGHALTVGASIGCARFGRDADNLEALLKAADSAMYAAKRFALPFCNYEAGMNESAVPNLEFDLWQALERGEISLVYQPQIRGDGSQPLRGCEALMRWKHPVAGDVEPTAFIAMAEKSGAIVPLGNWALQHACEQLRVWREQGLGELTLSLNVSLRQLREPGFLKLVEHALKDNGLPAHLLEMELSESQAVLFVEKDTRPIQALRELGVRIAIDDFGISFNSLSRLNTLSISSLKINAQCVQELTHSADARAISNCMIAIGQAMGIEVIAQGVETAEQAQVLSQQGCQVIQGYYSGHPVTAASLAHLVKAI